jgi:hypothetical protein
MAETNLLLKKHFSLQGKLRHRLEHSCCSAFLSIICHFAYLVTWSWVQLFMVLGTVWTTYLLNLQCLVVCIYCICTLEYLMQILWNCVPIMVSIANSYYIIISKPVTKWMVYLWPNYFQICDQDMLYLWPNWWQISDHIKSNRDNAKYHSVTI